MVLRYFGGFFSRVPVDEIMVKVGEVTDSNSLILKYGDEQAEVFNQDKNPVFIFK